MRISFFLSIIIMLVSSDGYSVDFRAQAGFGHSHSKIKSENAYSYDVDTPTVTFGGEIVFESFSLVSSIRNSRYFFSSRSRARNIEIQLGGNYYLGIFFIGGGISNSILQIENDDQSNYSFALLGPYISTGLKYNVGSKSFLKVLISHYSSNADSDNEIKDIRLENNTIDFILSREL